MVALISAPEGFEALLEPMPPGADLRRHAHGQLDVAVLFSTTREALLTRFAKAKAALRANGGLWVAYPKKSSRVRTDLSFSTVQQIGLAGGLVDNKSCAVDDTWTAVRFVVRLKDRPTP